MNSFDDFMEVVRTVRANCPWDSVQTHESLKPYLLNEAKEVLEGIDRLEKDKDSENLCEELGDVLFLIALHSVIAEEEGLFSINDVLDKNAKKMRFRHPKIFETEDSALKDMSWEELKKYEKSKKMI